MLSETAGLRLKTETGLRGMSRALLCEPLGAHHPKVRGVTASVQVRNAIADGQDDPYPQ